MRVRVMGKVKLQVKFRSGWIRVRDLVRARVTVKIGVRVGSW